MPLLDIVQSVARETGLRVPAVINAADKTTQRIVGFINKGGVQLGRKKWYNLIKEGLITTVNAEEQYDLPSDFSHFLSGTDWNRNDRRRLIQLAASNWQFRKSGLVTPTIREEWAIRTGNKFFVYPIPVVQAANWAAQGGTWIFTASDENSLVFDYFSKNWVSGDKTSLSDGQDTSLLDEDLHELDGVWRTLRHLRQPYDDEKNEFERQVDIRLVQVGGLPILNLARRRNAIANFPETEFGTLA